MKLGLIAALAAAAAVAATSASAAEGGRGWQTSKSEAGCSAYAKPKASESGTVERGAAFAAVTHRIGAELRDEISFVSGLPDVSDAQAVVRIAGEDVELIPFGGAAFVRSGAPEKRLMDAMSRNASLTVYWTLADGSRLADEYSLAGFRSAYAKASAACGLKRR